MARTRSRVEAPAVRRCGRRWSAARPLLALACAGSLFAAHAQGWQALPELLEPRQEIAGAPLGDALVVLGGFDGDRQPLASAESYRDGEDAWRALPPMPVAVHHPAAAVVGELLIVVGGYPSSASGGATDAVQIFDPATGAWRLGTPMPAPRGALAAVASEGRLIAVGGADRGASVADVQAYDPASDTWDAMPPMPTPRNHLGAAVLDGRVHVIGGRNEATFTLDVHEAFDPAAGTWATLEPMPTGRSGHALVAFGGCLLALGGEGNDARPDGVFAQVERFDPVAGAWSSLPPMAVPRHGMAALVDGDRVVVAGGADLAGFGASAVVEAFTPPACR